jgi:hypothetical protein
MSTGSKLKKIATAFLLGSGLLCAAIPAFSDTMPAQSKPQAHRKSSNKKKQAEPPPPLPSGPTGRPVQQMPLDAIATIPPQVTYENNQLTIIAPNSTLADILRAVRKQTGADIEIPSAPERVVIHLGPGPAREVVAELLNGSRFNYVLLGSPSDNFALTRVVLVAKNGPQEITPNPVVAGSPPPENQAVMQTEPEAAPEEAEAAEDNNADDNADQPTAEAEQQPPQDQPQGIKTPQQMLQEMQQRQMQLQQQQPAGQPPVPGSGMPPHPPQQN